MSARGLTVFVVAIFEIAAAHPCSHASADIMEDDASAGFVDAVAPADPATDAAPGSELDASTDACVSGETWDAKIEVSRRSGTTSRGRKSLDVVLLRSGQRKAIYGVCDQAGGGCGCDKSNPASLACNISPARAFIQIGTDDISTNVALRQQGDAIVADWTWGEFPGPNTAKKTEVLLTLPCAVTVRFVR